MGNPYLNPQPYYPGGGAPQMNDDVAHPGGHPSFTFGPNPYAGSAPQQNPGYGAVQRQQAPMIGGQTAPDNQGLVDALMAGSQVAAPPSGPAQNTTVANPDVTGAYGLNAQVNQANYASQMQNYQSGLGGLFNLGSSAIGAAGKAGSFAALFSDARLKRDIVRLATRPDGIGVYLYRYKAHPAWRVGVMAQEVQRIRPDAVGAMHGFLAVDYARLG